MRRDRRGEGPTASDTLMFFVDESGHEALASGHPAYGLGGCAVMAPQLDALLREPWRQVCAHVTGSPDTPLHAAQFRRDYPDHMDAVATFFRIPFFRFGAILTTATLVPDELHLVTLVAKALGNRIVAIAAHTRCQKVTVIFESSQRTDHMIEEAFSDFQLNENGVSLPIEFCFMKKREHEPALEVSDFVVNAVGGHARRHACGRTGFGKDFQAVFHSVDRRLTSFMLITEAEITESTARPNG